jgi:hypothetical protein
VSSLFLLNSEGVVYKMSPTVTVLDPWRGKSRLYIDSVFRLSKQADRAVDDSEKEIYLVTNFERCRVNEAEEESPSVRSSFGMRA